MKAIIFDLDGTICDIRHRLHFVQNGNRRWDEFFKAIPGDTPSEGVDDLYDAILSAISADGGKFDSTEIFFCSGRPEDYRTETREWLIMRGFFHDHLLMRASGDFRKDDVVKQEMLDGIRGQGYEVLFTVDDRQSVVDMWRRNGIPCFQVAPSEPEPKIYAPNEGTYLTLMVGPSGCGKSTWAKDNFRADEIISSDEYRVQLTGGIQDQTQNAKVFSAVHAVAQARLEHGLRVCIDATHLHARDRKQAVALAPEGTTVEYVVIDRPIESAQATRGWRGPWLEKHYQQFKSGQKHILNGDGLPNVKVRNIACEHFEDSNFFFVEAA